MVKKLTKAALLAAATAFLLAGFPACSSDDDDGDSNPTEVTAELAAEVGELTAGTPKTVNATVKVDGDTFSTTAKSIEPSGEIPEDSFALEADDVEVSKATLEEWVDDSTARISFTVTANEDSEGGKIHALIKAGTLTTCTEVVTTNSVIYTVKGKTPPADLTKTVRFFNDANATTPIHTETVTTGGRLTEAQLKAAESKLTAPDGKEFEKWDKNTEAEITEDKDFHAIWKDAEATGTTYAWNFQAEGLKSILSYTNNENNKPQLDAAGTYESTPAGLTLNLPGGGVFNKVEPEGSVGSKVTLDGVSKGTIEPDGSTLLTVEVKGPFTAVMLCGANSDNDKAPATNDGRYAFIKINDGEVCAPYKETNTLHAAGEKLSYTYSGTDTVTVGFGATNYVRIYDIKITTENGDGEGKTAGEVKSKATFVSQPDNTTANDVATLGLVGTSAESSDKDVATATIENGKVIITSAKKAGPATITVKDGDKEATIEVTVSGTGKITIVKITKYRAPIDMSKATVLIDYPAKKDGITLASVEEGAPSYTTVKIHANKDSVDCISLGKSGADYGVTLKVDGGFKAGDVIEIAGVYNNSSTKQGAVAILNGGDTLFTTKDFINSKTEADDPESETYVLEADAESLVLSRAGNTTTCITLLKVIRPSAE